MRVEWSRAANRNLESVEEYIGRDNPSAAIETVLEIVRQVGALATILLWDDPDVFMVPVN